MPNLFSLIGLHIYDVKYIYPYPSLYIRVTYLEVYIDGKDSEVGQCCIEESCNGAYVDVLGDYINLRRDYSELSATVKSVALSLNLGTKENHNG